MRIDLNAVLAGMEMILRRSLGDDILLALEMEAKLGPVLADASQVEQVVLNLAVNARDAMPRGGHLRIRTRGVMLDNSTVAGAAAGVYAVLSVRDSGFGMSQEIQQHIFEPFFTTKQPGKGTGLGLATVYGIVKQCGGFVKVTSQPGQGSTFEVYFPVNAGPVHGGASGEEKDRSQGEATILLVEDESDLRDLLQAGLMREGYRVLEAASAADALQASAAHQGQLDLLVTDVVLGGMSGRELAERLLMLRPGLKVLFISGHSGERVLEGGEIEGRMEFLQKPFAPSVLRRRVRQMLSTE
jgi:CheY-like chemotaxis protein